MISTQHRRAVGQPRLCPERVSTKQTRQTKYGEKGNPMLRKYLR